MGLYGHTELFYGKEIDKKEYTEYLEKHTKGESKDYAVTKMNEQFYVYLAKTLHINNTGLSYSHIPKNLLHTKFKIHPDMCDIYIPDYSWMYGGNNCDTYSPNGFSFSYNPYKKTELQNKEFLTEMYNIITEYETFNCISQYFLFKKGGIDLEYLQACLNKIDYGKLSPEIEKIINTFKYVEDYREYYNNLLNKYILPHD